jgi:hypothetical protein
MAAAAVTGSLFLFFWKWVLDHRQEDWIRVWGLGFGVQDITCV